MIRRVRLQRFKRFQDTTFNIPGTVVLAGPNNTGKTTLLQAIAAWSFALGRWKEQNNYHRRRGYELVPIARPAFASVPLRTFDLLWTGREYERRVPIEIEIVADAWSLTMELSPDSSEQIYVRPKSTHEPDVVRRAELTPVFVPPMTGLGTEEPLYQRPKVDQLLGQAKPGEVLRNLLVEAHANGEAWQSLTESISRLFAFTLQPPDSRGAHIVAEYRRGADGPLYDIGSAGTGFQQVLMLLTFLYARPASVLLIDEPDAHLHVILQDAIYGELRRVAAGQRSQLIMATHSEVIINAADPGEVCVLLGAPRMLASTTERRTLITALAVLSHEDVVLAMDAPGILYVEDYTDLQILRAWAKVLRHPALELLTTRLFWRPVVYQPRQGAEGIPAKKHYDALALVEPDLPGLQLIDGDARGDIGATPITGVGLQRLRWRRYEIESYLLHPAALTRFVERAVGPAAAAPHTEDLRRHFEENYPPKFLQEPHGDYPFLSGTKARTDLLPPALTAAGLPGFPYQQYFEIAELMLPEEIHPEVVEKLDAIVQAFRR
ncbi:MAG TPA: AAA family ATPase [Vicinamibacterales bacterium]|nr:AAA family ATPase [Vicinamibacterales bacterium]